MNTKKSPIQIEVFDSQIGGVAKRSVDARKLHSVLGNATAFSRWIARRIEESGFVENKDFLPVLAKNDEKGRPSTEYTITVEMAKHLCMMDRSDIGYQIREYFIKCEEKLIEINSLTANQFSTLYKDLQKAIAARKAADNKFEIETQEDVIELICLKLNIQQRPIEWLYEKKEEA
ncbi:TPA: antA/AntB antirepressor family protein [Vibrio cholerae]|nr:antA/AntB antirepressor family protein [Vibrio cholerae]HDI3145856.1 antA/AntB antirepressor family protein [Vibrio cholerae]HDZ3768558.1 antA/AntB antirepressor family protein [Vibrio cholerae]